MWKSRAFLVLLLAELAFSQQTRLGLLGLTHLGKDPTGSGRSKETFENNGNTFGRTNGNSPKLSQILDGNGQKCCCSASSSCPVVNNGKDDFFDLEEEDLVGSGLINPRTKKLTANIGLRIANSGPDFQEPTQCPRGRTLCCYRDAFSLSHLGSSCTPTGNQNNVVRQSCNSRIPRNGPTCGTRNFKPLPVKKGQSSPEEFPWTCLLLNQNNDFLGSCVIIPETFSNSLVGGTRKVITAAHKLNKLGQRDLLKVRVMEYDASGFNPPETTRHVEYTVVKFVTHPSFNSKRLTNDIALLTLDRSIDLSPNGVSAACLPSCLDMFDQGTRCWVAGWGKDSVTGNFRFIQNKVDVPLVSSGTCQNLIKPALARKSQRAAQRFRLDESELCAGGEAGKDACDGDGGAPLVCQSSEGLWHVVGLVAWGVGCAEKDVPGIYAKVSYFRNWIESN
eukprot:TRINITY_DN2626_c0_g1_i1.p1 TRINITY_DN2626_c0_g1~~TRINITY_DN2626_c0_g1_i1.p1  ORF type:complete len:448 (-),score=89.23 TRINITY_DN2626_c0_g1_i1:123-1466(-)